ncbi:Vacuolar protein sorting-associated protein 13 C-terminal, partial [Trinorchestia longiramus]
SSGVVWENRKYGGRKRRPFSVAHTEIIEAAHQRYSAQLSSEGGPVSGVHTLAPNLEVDFTTMTVRKPFNRHLHRTYEPGLWLQMQTFPQRQHLHFKVNKVQVDNQLTDVLFPVVFFRVNPAKSVMAETVPKPLFEVSVVQVTQPTGLLEYKYVSALLQEFHVMVEMPFISALLAMIYPQTDAQQLLYTEEKVEQDTALVHSSLTEALVLQQTASPVFFHYLHLSPIKMHLSFSLTGLDASEGAGGDPALGGQVLHLFLQSVGVTLTEMQDIEFRMGYFERKE